MDYGSIKMNHITTIPTFSFPLFIYKLDIKEDLTLKFNKIKDLTGSHDEKPRGAESNLMSVDMDILSKFKNLKKEIDKAIYTTLKDILKLKNTQYRICNSWLTKTKPSQFSTSHTHKNSWLSGVYYPKANPDFCIRFYNDFGSPFFIPPTEFNIYNSTEWTIFPEDNYLILFYSQLRHKIMPNKGSIDRYSIAFNVLPKGEIGLGDTKIIF
jgi:uncharacterized protein (TIGR02466 family)